MEKSQVDMNDVVLAYLKDQKSQRKWRWIKRAAWGLLIAFLIYQAQGLDKDDKLKKNAPHVGLIDLQGVIFDGQAGSADNLVKGLHDAYDSEGLKALIIRINSPGGSPVQADYMFNAIKRYKAKHKDIKIYAVCVDLCASAAYYVASAADEIYANPSSMVGSIGVIYNGFGFVDVMQKVGVTRRMQTAGVNKGFLDPFSPETPEQTAFLQHMLDTVHQQFIARVKEGRGDRLHVTADTFSGLVWTGSDAKTMGLIDGFASSGELSTEVLKLDSVIDYTFQPTFYEKLAKNFGTAMANQLPLSLGITPSLK